MESKMKRHLDVKRRFFLAIAGLVFFGLLTAAGAVHAATGISGYVKSVEGQGLNDVTVQIWGVSPGATDFIYWPTGVGNIEGYYEFNGLLPGTYKVYADTYGSDYQQYMPTWYQNEQFYSNADIVTVTSGQVTQNIDITLARYGAITGRITDETTGDPIPGVRVNAHNTAGGQYGILNDITDVNGQYTLYVRTGIYRVYADTDGTPYQEEYYDNAAVQAGATLIAVAEGSTVSDIDFALVLHTGGSISGRVLDPDGNPVGFAYVSANTLTYCDDCYVSAQTDMDGYYVLDKVNAGHYWVRASHGSQEYPEQYYYRQVGQGNANPVPVTLGQDTPHIDFKFVRGGKISGQVRYPNADPVQGMYISASAISGGGWGNAVTDAAGNYEIDMLPPGQYTVYANPVDGQNADKIYMVQYYNHRESEEDADPVNVIETQTTSGIDFDLIAGGTISGTLRDRNGNTIASRRINAWPADGDGNYYAYTDNSGHYTIHGLPYGGYTAAPELSYQTEQDYLRVYYDQKPRYEADVITLSVGAPDATGIDFQMVLGGKISGRVTISGTSTGLADVDIAVISPDGRWIEESYTDGAGNYVVSSLPAGTFKVLADPYESDYAFGYYHAGGTTSDWAGAGDVPVSLGATTPGINFSLAIGGKIAGRVDLDVDGQIEAMAGIQVDAQDGAYELLDYIGYDNTDSEGNYEIRGLPAGSYKIRVANHDDEYAFAGEYYNDQANWADANSVAVTAGSTTTDIDLILALATPRQSPRLISPANQTAASLPVFEWTTVSGGATYDLRVNDLTEATDGVIDENVAGTTFTPSSPLTPGHEYSALVRAVNSAGTGDWSPVTLFTQLPPVVNDLTITVDPAGSGTVVLEPAGGSYDAGTEVTLTAVAGPGWMFQSWTGDVENSASPGTTITVDQNPEEVTVTFLPDIDSDGVSDAADNCPDVANGDQDDTDADGLGDACDICPSDPDNDADGDGACGNVDACPDDPAKQTDVDTDGDGLANCVDSDDDNDGLPDAYEMLYDWLDPLDPADALADQDNDNHTNIKEYLAGSDPDDWLSYPQIQIADWYVNGDVASSGNGASWATAFKTIEEALAAGSHGDEIWVKAGTYAPDAYLEINKTVEIYGGFAGTESQRGQRDWRRNTTTVDGRGAIDHCFYIDTQGLDGVAIDGFTITGGYADGPDIHARGGGIYAQGSTPTIANCVFINNSATGATFGGGAVYASANITNGPVIVNCAFYGNHAVGGITHGGAISLQSCSSPIINCIFAGNTAGGHGGAVLVNGQAPTITNCTFFGNAAGGSGGAFHNANGAVPVITNSILWGDSASGDGPEIYNDNISDAVVEKCIVDGGDQQDWYVNGDNISLNPLFVDAANNDLHILPASPGVDAGDDTAVPGDLTTDWDGDARIIGSAVDIGADEYNRVWYVDAGADASGSGMFWAEAFQTLQEALDAAQSGDQIWVKQGDYLIGSAIDVAEEVSIFAGFAGTEITRQQRDWVANTTTIDGQGSAAHCFVVSENATIDGFTITGGNASGSGPDNNGGGIYIGAAGAMVSNCRVAGNNASGAGGGIYNLGTSALTNCVIFGNDAISGGGVASEDASLTMVNCTLSKNEATHGGGVWTNDTSSAAVVINSIVWANTAAEGAGIYAAGMDPAVTHSDVEGGTGETWFAGTDLDEDPFFVDSANDDFHLRGNSPCLDAGNDAAVPADVTKDYDGDDRILDGDEDGTPAVDMGVDEYRHVPATWHVDGDLPNSGDGTSWAQAFKTLEEALDNPLLRNFDQIWVKQGTYTPPGLGGWSNGAGLTIEKYIKLYGGFPASLPEPAWTDRNWNLYGTIIDADAAGQINGRMRCLNIAGSYSNENRGYPVVDGFILTGGHQYSGGGIYINNRAPTISNCVIAGNSAPDYGGGICAFNAMQDNVVSNCLIFGNEAPTGGAVAAFGDAAPNLVNCTVTGNTTTGESATGTIFISPSNLDRFAIVNTIIWGNAVESGIPAIYFNGDSFPYWANLSYNTIEGASTETWFNNGAWNNTPGNNGSGNVDTDPLFVDPDGADNDAGTWADNDYHPGALDCINSGSNASVASDVSDLDGDGNTGEPAPFDLSGDPRFSGTVDMGALEVGDSDGDGVMDIDDNCPFADNPLQEDGDGDQIGDACDGCPSDPDKIDPGQCGCGAVDTDTDSDGTADCVDPDDDGDDLPDIWETAYGLDPLDADGIHGRDGDFDSDGYVNYDEYLSGTEPHQGTSLPMEVQEVIPHDGAGIAPDTLRIPNNASFAVRIVAAAGIDITVETGIVFTVDDGTTTPYLRNLNDPAVGVTKLDPNEDDTAVTALWAVYHRSREDVYDWDSTVQIRVDATDANNVAMVQQSYAFQIETQAEHDAAQAASPATMDLGAGNPEVDAELDYDAALAVDSGDLAGCRIFYDSGEPVWPMLGPSDELPPLDAAGADAVGVPMNLQPPTVFSKPVKLVIPCPGEPDVSLLSVYLFNGVDWVEACNAAGVVQPGAEEWMVEGSREDDNAVTPPVISIEVYHFTGVQAAAAVPASSGGGGSGGGGCFVALAAKDSAMTIYGLVIGLAAAIALSAVRARKRA